MFISQQIIPEICYKRMFLTKYILRLVLCVFFCMRKDTFYNLFFCHAYLFVFGNAIVYLLKYTVIDEVHEIAVVKVITAELCIFIKHLCHNHQH